VSVRRVRGLAALVGGSRITSLSYSTAGWCSAAGSYWAQQSRRRQWIPLAHRQRARRGLGHCPAAARCHDLAERPAVLDLGRSPRPAGQLHGCRGRHTGLRPAARETSGSPSATACRGLCTVTGVRWAGAPYSQDGISGISYTTPGDCTASVVT